MRQGKFKPTSGGASKFGKTNSAMSESFIIEKNVREALLSDQDRQRYSRR